MGERATRSTEALADVAEARLLCPGVFAVSPWRRARRGAWVLGFVVLAGYAAWWSGLLDGPRWVEGLGRLGSVLGFMLPPSLGGQGWMLLGALFETLAMALIGTLLAAVVAVPLGLLGARNVVGQAVMHFGLRRLFDGLRGVDQLIWALIFINVVGLGPFAGVLAIAVSDCGVLAKLFSEAVENTRRQPAEAVRASGGGRLAVVRLAVVPQVLPLMLSHVLYYLESNTRSAMVLGVVGAGGIGLHLAERIRINAWPEASGIILLILAAVVVIDTLSRLLRRRVL